MTKVEVVAQIARQTGLDRASVLAVVESFMDVVKTSLTEDKEGVFLRGFGSFVPKTRKAKIGRNIRTNEALEVPQHDIVSFRPAREFVIK